MNHFYSFRQSIILRCRTRSRSSPDCCTSESRPWRAVTDGRQARHWL